MTCQCGLKLDKCFWPGQCEMDIVRHKTNQQATADHTAKMFNQSKLRKVIAGLSDYDPTQIPIKQWNEMMYGKETKMTRKEAINNVRAAFNPGYPVVSFVNALEALGLIKFDEEIGPFDNIQRSKLFEFYHPVTDEIKDGYLTTNACKALIDALDKYGYKIVKK